MEGRVLVKQAEETGARTDGRGGRAQVHVIEVPAVGIGGIIAMGAEPGTAEFPDQRRLADRQRPGRARPRDYRFTEAALSAGRGPCG